MKNKNRRNDNGSVLIIALIILVVLVFAASTSMMNSVTNVKIGGNYAKTIGVFDLAETGIAKGKLLLKNTADFDTLLNTTNYPGGVIIPTVTEANGTYSVVIANNLIGTNPDPGGAANDTDNIVVITSTAVGKTGNTVRIEAYIGRPTTISFPASPPGTGGGAAALCGAGPNVTLKNGMISGYDTNVPASFTCSGASCTGTKVSPPSGTYGIVLDVDANAADRIDNADLAHLEGYCATPPCDYIVNPALDCTAWKNLSNQLAALGDGPRVNHVSDCSDLSGKLGTREVPQILIINTVPGGTCSIGSSTDGAGVLVITSDTLLSFGANMHYEGVIIMLGDNGSFRMTSTADFFGQVIVNSKIVDIAPEIETSNPKSFLNYSTAAIATAMNAMNAAGGGGGGGGAQLITYSWSEKY